MVAENPNLLRNVKLSKVSEISGQVVPEELDYFRPTAEHFLHELPRFPPGFVLNHHPVNNHNNNNNNFKSGNKEPLTHLDKLFVKSSGGAISSRLNSSDMQNFVVGVKYWDGSRGEWVADNPGAR